MFDLIYKGPTTCMHPVMECNSNFFALNNILQSTYLTVTASIYRGQMLSASMCSGVRDEEPNDPQCSQM